jgi:hypothetical protein
MPTRCYLARPVAARASWPPLRPLLMLVEEEIGRSDAIPCLILVGSNPLPFSRFLVASGGVGHVGGRNAAVFSSYMISVGLVRSYVFELFMLNG